ncbi:hypothetical protein niasHT_003991 [Heterodera trifolii]|uniref:Integrase catalytic domain-containing protein n=1 Tax=Heterodera trifolii TaxID=157864 RepID=A0ABD2LWC2_9BILA
MLARNESFLETLCNAKKVNHLIRDATDEQLLCLVEICLNILKGRVPLRTQHLNKLKAHALVLRRLARTRCSRSAKKVLLQHGDGLPAIMGLIASIALPLIADHTKRYLLVPEDIYQSLTSPPPSDGTPIGLVRNRIKQIKNDDGINEAERAIKYAQELKRLNKLTKDEDERPSTSEDQLLSLRVAISRLGVRAKENVEQLEDDDDDDDHHETPKPSSSNKRQPSQTEILKLIYKNAQSLGVSEEGQVLRAGGRPFITSSVYDIVSHLLNKDKRAQNKEPTAFKEFVERARQIPLLTIIMDLKKLRLLEYLYKDLSSPVAFTSVESLLREARKSQRKISRTDVQNYLASQRTYTLHRQAKRRYRRLPTLAPGLHTEWQADLAIFDRLGKQNRGYKYLLVCIDTLSRQVFVEPVKTKTSANMIIAFGRIFKRSKYIPWKVLTDQGKEFTARAVQHFFRTKDVEHFCMLTSPQFHAGMAEPENVVRSQPKYRVGDRVRIEKYKHVFQKGYLPRFTNELFTVVEVHTERSPVVYRLRDDKNEIISGWFYANDLCKTLEDKQQKMYEIEKVLKKKKQKGVDYALVKWKGL